jgi:hypothetical protein
VGELESCRRVAAVQLRFVGIGDTWSVVVLTDESFLFLTCGEITWDIMVFTCFIECVEYA